VDERHQQEARRQHRHADRRGQLGLVLHQEAAVRGDRAHAFPLELPRALDEGGQEPRGAAPDDQLGRRAGHSVIADGEREGGRMPHVARDAREARVQHEDADGEAILVEAASHPPGRAHVRSPNSPPAVPASQSLRAAPARDRGP
jgi:hypothetical protein